MHDLVYKMDKNRFTAQCRILLIKFNMIRMNISKQENGLNGIQCFKNKLLVHDVVFVLDIMIITQSDKINGHSNN